MNQYFSLLFGEDYVPTSLKMIDTLPNPSLNTKAAKTPDMIHISSMGLRGENDFRCLQDTELDGGG